MPTFKKSTRKNKKYMVLSPKKKWIHFGDTRYQHFKDSTGLGLYSNLDHGDRERQKNYLTRAKGIRDGDGKLTWKNPETANYYAVKYLW
jgi:hypothetical protein